MRHYNKVKSFQASSSRIRIFFKTETFSPFFLYTNRIRIVFARPYDNAQTSEIHKLFEGMSCMMYVIIVSYVFVRPHANSKWAFWKNSNSTRILFQISAFLVAENLLWRLEGMLKRRKKISVFISGRGLRINLFGPSSSTNAISYGNLINLSLGCEFNRTWIIVTAQNVLTSIMFRCFFFVFVFLFFPLSSNNLRVSIKSDRQLQGCSLDA